MNFDLSEKWDLFNVCAEKGRFIQKTHHSPTLLIKECNGQQALKVSDRWALLLLPSSGRLGSGCLHAPSVL